MSLRSWLIVIAVAVFGTTATAQVAAPGTPAQIAPGATTLRPGVTPPASQGAPASAPAKASAASMSLQQPPAVSATAATRVRLEAKLAAADARLTRVRTLRLPAACGNPADRKACSAVLAELDAAQADVDGGSRELAELHRLLCLAAPRAAPELARSGPLEKLAPGDCERLAGAVRWETDGLRAATSRRQSLQQSFQNFDQKVNQLFNILATVLKNEKETEAGISRSIQ